MSNVEAPPQHTHAGAAPPPLVSALRVILPATDLQVDLAALQAWAEQLKLLAPRSRVEDVSREFLECIELLRQTCAPPQGDSFALSFCLLSSMVASRVLGIHIPEELAPPLLSASGAPAADRLAGDWARILGFLLDRCYEQALTTASGPAKYAWLAGAVLSHFPGLFDRCGDQRVPNYAGWLKYKIHGFTGPDYPAPSLPQHIDRVFKLLPPKPNAPPGPGVREQFTYSRLSTGLHREAVALFRGGMEARCRSAGAIQIVAIGSAQSGKSAFLNSFMKECGDGGSGLPFDVVFPTFAPGQVPPAGASFAQPVVVHEGHTQVGGRITRLLITDSSGGILITEALQQQYGNIAGQLAPVVSGAHVLFLTLAPEDLSLDEATSIGNLGQLIPIYVTHVRRALEKNPDLMVSLLFTKSDEYALCENGQVRLVSTYEQIKLLERAQEVLGSREAAPDDFAKAWEAFASAVSGDLGKAGARTRRTLLRKTEPLWTQLLQLGVRPSLLNAYFVCPTPVLPQTGTSQFSLLDRGILHPFNDLLEQASPRPAERDYAMIGFIILVPFTLGLSWILINTFLQPKVPGFTPENFLYWGAFLGVGILHWAVFLYLYFRKRPGKALD